MDFSPIKDIQIVKKTLHFNTPFKIAYEEVDLCEVIFIKITDFNGLFGTGSASIDTEVTGETVEGTLSALEDKLNKDFFEFPISKWYKYHEKIQKTFENMPSAQSAIEEAILNLWSKQSNISLKHFFGNSRNECETMITIPIGNEQKTNEDIKNRLTEGFKIIKIKCGLDIDEDISRIQKAQKIIPETHDIVLDANQGYSFDDAKKILSKLEDTHINIFEQPISAKNWEGLKELHQTSKIPIIADESVVNTSDAYKLLSEDYVSGVNMKLMKCGGPINFLQTFLLAKSLNKIIMIGCMYESNVSMTMGANLALGLPIDYVDLDSGHLDFPDDPAVGGAEVNNGKLSINKPLDLNL